MLHNTISHHSLTNANPLFLNPDQLILQLTPPVYTVAIFYGGHVPWCGISL